MNEEISECPICGGGLQATRETYCDQVMIDRDGVCHGYREIEELSMTLRVYCENDHTFEEIMEYINDESILLAEMKGHQSDHRNFRESPCDHLRD